tara:strand:+ start:1818 stop:2975 length:1158 start_codon:yes stop_codon:yes gene_type:complete
VRIAFYAPLKSPRHPRPSGDRAIARLFIEAFERGGHTVELASEFRSREGNGDEFLQKRLRDVGQRLGRRLARRLLARPLSERPAVWFTYHLYYKAPDWIGPAVARALDIPYIVAEASFAPKRDRPPWQMVHRAVGETIAGADAVVALNNDDVPCLLPLFGGDQSRIHHIPPFMDVRRFARMPGKREHHRACMAATYGLDADATWLIAVGMMRYDKLASHTMLAEALSALMGEPLPPWQLLVIGDGQTRAEVEASMAALGERVKCLGLLQPDALAGCLKAADLYVWPGVNEAFGMAFLEAQACGLPIVAGRTRGVPDVVAHGVTGVLTELSARGVADGIRTLLAEPQRRQQLAARAAAHVLARHDLAAAGAQLNVLLRQLTTEAQR